MQARSEITSGICGFTTTVDVDCVDYKCTIDIESECPNVQKLAAELTEVDAFGEISYRGGRPRTFELAEEHLQHTACPVSSGIIKAIEVAAELAFPKDACITITRIEDA
jgi:hypothetical protein